MRIEEKNPKIFDEEPKRLTLEQAKNYFDTSILDQEIYDRGVTNVLAGATESFVTSVKKIPSQLQMAYGQYQYAKGEEIESDVAFKESMYKLRPQGNKIYNGNKEVEIANKYMESGKLNIQTANRNIETLNKELESEMPNLSPEDRQGLLMSVAQQGADYGLMLGLSYIHPAIGLGYMGIRTFGSETEEGATAYKKKKGTIEGFEAKSSEELTLNVANTVVQTVWEKAFGAPAQLKRFKTVKDYAKAFIGGFGEEFLTENLQNATDAVFDKIGDRLSKDETVYTRIMENLRDTVIAGMFGGTAGTAFAIHNRSKGIEHFEGLLAGTDVDQSKINEYATVLYDSAVDNLQGVVSKELEIDSSLKAKHGEVYNTLVNEITSQIKDMGALTEENESKVAQYVAQTAKEQADWLVGESMKRNTTIDDVWKASEVVFKDGKLYLQGATKKTKLKKLKAKKETQPSVLQFIRSKGGVIDEGGELKNMDASKQYIGLVNKNGIELDTMGEALWEAGYFAERPTVSEVLDYIDDELRGVKHYPLGYVEQKGVSQAENEAMLNDAISEYAEIMEYDISKMSFEEKQQIYEQMQRNLFASEDVVVEGEEVVEDFGFTDNEFFQVADEMARLDDVHPEYKGETININGQEKTVYNSTGERIAKSKEALDNFYNWFGDSKVVDDQGRPLVVYHGTSELDIKSFDKDKGYSATDAIGSWFGNEKIAKQRIKDRGGKGKIYSVYLSIDKPAVVKTRENLNVYIAERLGNISNDEIIEMLEDDVRLYPNDYKFTLDDLESYKNNKETTGVRNKINTAILNSLDPTFRDELLPYVRNAVKDLNGIIIENDMGYGMTYVAFEPNQIKSTSNRGTYSESDNIYLQTAFHGTGALKLEGGKFSLSKTGTGEGHQAHGYGIYATVEYDVADKKYRKMIADAMYGEQADFFNEERLLDEYNKQESVASKSKKQQDWDKLAFLEELLTRHEETTLLEEGEYSDDIVDWYNRNIREKVINKDRKQGQVFELDVPENDFLINEQLKYENQPDVVKQALDDIFESADPNYPNKEAVLKKYKDKIGASLYNLVAEVEYFNKHKTLEGELARDSDAFKLASEKLNALGVKGITYDGKEDGRSFVIFNPEDINVIKNFYQITNLPKQEKKIKGAFNALTKSIKITSEADFSTYQHEFAHFWLDNIFNYVNSGQASEKYLKQFNEMKKWLGTKGNYPTREQHEKFARAYEKYLYKGTYANSPIGDVFGEYENFIREVYSDIAEIDTRVGKKYKPIPRLMYNFFDSMVSGKLPGIVIDDEPKEEVAKEVKEVKRFVEEETKILEENRANYTLKPVQTDTKTGYLTAYEKMTGEQVEAGSIELKDQMEKAESFVANNLEQAERIVNGLEPAPDGIVKNAIYIAYNNLQKRLGNTSKRVNGLLNQALELRRMGQEISSQRLAYTDEASALYWIRKVQESKVEALADASGLTVAELNEKVTESVRKGLRENKSAQEIAKQLREELGVTELYQTEVYPTEETDVNAYNYVYKYVNEQLGLGMSMEDAETITRKADDMLSSLENSMSETGNPSVEYFIKLKDMESFANSIAPSSQARVAVSVVGRGNLLASIKSPVTNIVSNGFVGAFRGAVRRIKLGVTNSIVSPEVIKQNKAYSWEIFKKTGYNVNNITPETPRNTILGEKLTHSEGKGWIRKLGRVYEEIVYKWGLGAGDVLFKDYAFTDYVALKATKLAKGDVNKANAIFKDACLIDPQTDEGKEIRQEAIQESLIATFQNKGAISEGALKARSSIDFGVGFGEIVAPFVKTPANIVSMGLKAGFGSVRAIASEIKRDIKAGKILKPTKENIDLVVQNGLGLLLASMIINAIDDDDYMPPYALATSKDKQLAKELNIPFNAVKIGNTWVSLDYLGALASPLVGLLQARREEGFLNNIYGYSKSAGVQALSIPAFGNISDLFEKVQNLVRKSGDEVMSETGQGLLEQAYARVIPAIFSDIAKALDSYERETKGDEIITKIPFARERAFEKISVTSGKAEELGNPIYDILFGSRVKEQVSNDVADELQRLNNAGWGVSLTTVTRSGLLSELDDKTKQKVREDFAEEYSKQVKRLIKTPRYKRLSDEDKQESVNKIRRSIVEKLKKRYLKNRKK